MKVQTKKHTRAEKRTLKTIESILQEVMVGPKGSDSWNTAYMMLIAAMVLGASNIDKIAKFSKLPREFVRVRARRLRENKIWVKDLTICDWSNEETGVTQFLEDVSVAEGLMTRKTPAKKSKNPHIGSSLESLYEELGEPVPTPRRQKSKARGQAQA